ncbi:MAG TPA: methylated-DNA--[protein]-cysteine S-methyltransferase [Xanthobacteraceae bacterium]|nr:methylated-DNA--[protein]-cysteine S-methyltransferase [Xanthobacteraceae bacterium]
MTSRQPESLSLDRFATPIGTALLVTDSAGILCALDWEDYAARLGRLLRRTFGAIELREGADPDSVRQPLAGYFAGDLAGLNAIATRTGGTPFQCAVWSALRTIEPGRTISYGALAARIGAPAAVRAVGLANGANPIGIVVPCHRVIGADGSLTGYGGGLHRKRWLLDHESGSAISHRNSAPV